MEGKPKTYARLLTNSQQNNDGGKTQDIHQIAGQIKKNHGGKTQDNTRVRILIFFQNLTLGLFCFPPPRSEYFFSNIDNQNIFLGKKPYPLPPPIQV
jgi:hypothetical protein